MDPISLVRDLTAAAFASGKPEAAGVSAAAPTHGHQYDKLKRAAEQFEAMLLQTMLKGFGRNSLDGSKQSQDPAAGNLSSMGMQAFTDALAREGGLGFAKMVMHDLAPYVQDQAVETAMPAAIAAYGAQRSGGNVSG